MKQGAISWLFVVIGITVVSTQANEESLRAVTQANNIFSSKLYDVIRKSSKENLIVSPLSVSTVLAMLHAGARGKTAEALRSSLNFPSEDVLNSGYQLLLQTLQSDDSVTLELVNRLFPAEGYKLNSGFSNTLKTYYNADPVQVNYAKNVEAAETINRFVTNATHDRIHDLIQSSDLDHNTRLVLVNAIYFKGEWKTQFPKSATEKMDFFTGETDSVKVDMMRLETDLMYADIPELDAQAVALPYKGDRYSMLILLPNNRTGLVAMEDKLSSYPIDRIMDSMRERKVLLYLPKFKLESTIDLLKPLTSLGLGDLFVPGKADLSGIPSEDLKNKEQLYVSKAIQKAFIEVNEEGSEAAAATASIVQARSGIMHEELRADHPFKTAIIERQSRSRLFVSAVLDPTVFETRFRSLIGDEEINSGVSSTFSATILTCLLPLVFVHFARIL